MGLPDFIKKWFRPAPLPVIAVGTDIASYQLLEYLNNSPKFAPLYVLNEEPWHHLVAPFFINGCVGTDFGTIRFVIKKVQTCISRWEKSAKNAS